MGITCDQITKAHLNRLKLHYKALERLQEGYAYDEVVEYEMHAWAFARVLMTSEYLRRLLGDLLEAQTHSETIWNLAAQHAQDEASANDPSPILALTLAELVLKTCVLLSERSCSVNETAGAYDAYLMIAKWRPFGDESKEIFLALRPEDYDAWSLRALDSRTWMGFPRWVQEYNLGRC